MFLIVNGFWRIGKTLINLARYKPLRPLKEKLESLNKISRQMAETVKAEFSLEGVWQTGGQAEAQLRYQVSVCQGEPFYLGIRGFLRYNEYIL